MSDYPEDDVMDFEVIVKSRTTDI